MINFSIKLSNSQSIDFTKLITEIFKITPGLLFHDDYFHYYNIQSLWKKLFDKQFKGFVNNNTIKININEFESLKYIIDVHRLTRGPSILGYYEILLLKVIGDIDKQVLSKRKVII